jgi:hypothetical protein
MYVLQRMIDFFLAVVDERNANHNIQWLVLEVMPRMAGGHFATSTRARHDYEVGMRPNWKGSVRRTPKTPAKTPARGGSWPSRRPPVTPRTPFDARGDREHAIDLIKIACGTDGRTAVSTRL